MPKWGYYAHFRYFRYSRYFSTLKDRYFSTPEYSYS